MTHHPREIVGEDVRSHIELVDHQSAEGGGWRKERAIDNENVDILRSQFGSLKDLTNTLKHNGLTFLTSMLCRINSR
jgi:hypothetical protein